MNSFLQQKSHASDGTIEQENDPSRFQLAYADIVMHEKVGQGCSAEVFRATYAGQVVACKKISLDWPSRMKGSKEEKNLQREVAIMCMVEHPKLVNLIGVTQDPFCIITEFCAGGALFELLHNSDEDIELTSDQQRKMLLDIGSAMAYLHGLTPQIIHRDLKSLNLLLSSVVGSSSDPVEIKVSDFGLGRMKEAQEGEDAGVMTRGMGTCHWMAPEVFTHTQYDAKVDVYSFGIIIFEILSRELPYEDEEAETVGLLVVRGERPDMEALRPDSAQVFRNLMTECWDQDPQKRPTFAEVLRRLENEKPCAPSSSSAQRERPSRGRRDPMKWASSVAELHPLRKTEEFTYKDPSRYRTDGAIRLRQQAQRLRHQSGNVTAQISINIVESAAYSSSSAITAPMPPVVDENLWTPWWHQEWMNTTAGPTAPSLDEVLEQLRIEDRTDAERENKFRLFESYSKAVETIRSELLDLWGRSERLISRTASYDEIDRDLSYVISSSHAMCVEEDVDGRWLAYDMTKKAAKNNEFMASILTRIEAALAEVEEANDQDGLDGESAWAHNETDAQPDCPVCMEKLSDEGEPPHVIQRCKHRVCATCWDQWVQVQHLHNRAPFCPLCRREDFVVAIHRVAQNI